MRECRVGFDVQSGIRFGPHLGNCQIIARGGLLNKYVLRSYIGKKTEAQFFLLDGVSVLMQWWFRQKVGAFWGESGVGFGRTMGEVLGDCGHGFGSHLH